MTDQMKSNLDAQRTRIMQAILNDVYALSAHQTPKVTAYCDGEYLAENGGPTQAFIDECLGVDEVTLRVKINGERKGFVHVIWVNGTGGAISDFSENFETVLTHALNTAEFLDV
jgi:hypothetical protein